MIKKIKMITIDRCGRDRTQKIKNEIRKISFQTQKTNPKKGN